MLKTRRQFLRSCVTLGTAGALSPLHRFGAITAHAQSPVDYRALVCIFLNGGNDSNNMIVPIDSRYARYATTRGPLALAANSLLPAGGSGLGFHPALPGIRRLFNQNAASVALNVGPLVQPTTRETLTTVPLPRSLQSHVDQRQQWQSSDPSGGATGWAGRVNDVMRSLNTGRLSGVTAGGGNPFFLAGAQTRGVDIGNVATSGLYPIGWNDIDTSARLTALQRLLSFDSGLKLVTAANGVLSESLTSFQEINAVVSSAAPLPVTFPATGLGRQLEQMATLMSVRGSLGMNRQIFYASMGGFDTHEELLNTQHALLSELDGAVDAFVRALEALGLSNNVTLFTESDFNRTLNVNAAMGTDHGWGGHHLIVGPAVGGGTLYGRFPALELRGPDDLGDRGVWIPTTSIDQYAATLAEWFGVQPSQMASIFPNLSNFATPRLTEAPAPVSVFSDDPLLPGATVRAVHLTEVRNAIGELRARYGLSAPAWTDPKLVPGVTVIKRVHLTELRAAMDAVYVAASRSAPAYAALTTSSPISAEHIAELRIAIMMLW